MFILAGDNIEVSRMGDLIVINGISAEKWRRLTPDIQERIIEAANATRFDELRFEAQVFNAFSRDLRRLLWIRYGF